ncbi:MAG TPA: hypothetical protein VGV92_07640 [Gammaproteobacteria bacterium]|nr:hypothetical protein [Gammaproteobacteria bacterium]
MSAVLALASPLAKIRHEIEKGGIKPIKFLSDSFNTPFEKLLKQLTALLEKVKKGGIAEHGQHLKDHISALKAAKEKMSTSEKSTLAKTIPKKYSFHVKQWDKSDIHTFELGDFLGCCLATNRSQFQAMVQRRMDVGMLTDVVVDDELKEPISGNWLFFARDKDHPEDVYVVANFYEIRAGYGDKPALRDRIIQELTEFTAQYANDIGAKGYLIRPLTYGLIPDNTFSAQLGSKNIQLEKIGGFFDPLNRGNVSEKDKQNQYYLLALELKQFYDATAPAKQEEKKYKSDFFSPASGPVPTELGPAQKENFKQPRSK